MVLPAVVMALISFSFSSVLTATAVWWTTGKGRMQVWFSAHLPLVLNSLVAAMGATVIAVFYDRAPFIILAVVPLIGLTWGWTMMHQARLSRASAN